jgi:selenocysteine lyase/cysteine desulfurase
MTIPSSVRDLFAPAPGITYLDAATVGLPPKPTIDALERALQMWQNGTADWANDWDREGDACRDLFATLIGASAEEIGLVPTVSAGVGIVAASIPEHADVLVPEGEFPSVLYPFLVAGETRGVRVREAPFATLYDAITPETTLVAFSLTQSQSGRTAPLADICAAAKTQGAQVLVDSTHGTPFVSVAEQLPAIDYLICHGYKHLLCPRGAGFIYVRRDRQDEIAPYMANIRSAMPTESVPYGGPLVLRNDAARFDLTLAWHSWVGARKSLELLVQWQREGVLASVLDLTARLADGLGLDSPTSSIVTFPVADAEAAGTTLLAAGVKGAARGGNIRLAPHVYNTEADIDRAVEAISSLALATAAD